MATNRIDSLDPALIRPGRIDRKIEFPLPDEKTRRMIFKIHTGRMTLATDVNLEELIMAKDDLSGADIKVSSMMFISHSFIFLFLGNLY
jgi:26S proteasome regulatory subunit T2